MTGKAEELAQKGYSLNSDFSTELVPLWVYLTDGEGDVVGMAQLSKEGVQELKAGGDKPLDEAVGMLVDGLRRLKACKAQELSDAIINLTAEYFFNTKTGNQVLDFFSPEADSGVHCVVMVYEQSNTTRPFAFTSIEKEVVSPEGVKEFALKVIESDRVRHPEWFVRMQ